MAYEIADKLEAAIASLERQVAHTESSLQTQIDTGLYGDCTIDDLKDSNMRPILLDARIALVNGLAALLRIA
jgi:hypothetical protein